MKTRLFSLILLAGGFLLPLTASAQCVALPECSMAGLRLSDPATGELCLQFFQTEPKFWQRVKLGTSTTSPFQAPFATSEAAPWPSTDLLQPWPSIRAEWAVYQDPSPSGIRLSLGYVRGARGPAWLPRERGTTGIILKIPFTLLNLR